MTKAERSKAASILGKKGRLALKKKREAQTPEERSEVARKAARARWDKATPSAGATPQGPPAVQQAQN